MSSGIITRESGKFYSDIYGLRQESDYEYLVEFEEHEVIELRPHAKNLIDQIEKIVLK